MKALGDLFGSAAKTEILRALYHQPDAIGLRQLARIAGVGVRSAELALASLEKAKLVRRQHKRDRPSYAMVRTGGRAAILSEVFDAAAVASIREGSRSLGPRARIILPFIRQVSHMLDHARGVEERHHA